MRRQNNRSGAGHHDHQTSYPFGLTDGGMPIAMPARYSLQRYGVPIKFFISRQRVLQTEHTDTRILKLTHSELDDFLSVAVDRELQFCYSVEGDDVYVFYPERFLDDVADIYFAICALDAIEHPAAVLI
jgi:hypothetical protein